MIGPFKGPNPGLVNKSMELTKKKRLGILLGVLLVVSILLLVIWNSERTKSDAKSDGKTAQVREPEQVTKLRQELNDYIKYDKERSEELRQFSARVQREDNRESLARMLETEINAAEEPDKAFIVMAMALNLCDMPVIDANTDEQAFITAYCF